MNKLIQFTLAYAAYSIIISLVFLYTKPELMFGFSWATGVILVGGLVVLIVLGRHFLRGDEDSFLSYGAAVKKLFIGGVIAALISAIVTTGLFSNNTELKEQFDDIQIETSTSTMKWGMEMAGASEADVQNAIDEYMEQIESGEQKLQPYPYGWDRIPFMLATSAFMGLLYSLIAARWVREKEEASFS